MPDWSEVLKEHGPLVWKTIYRLIGNHADAADCFQDTFLRALRISNREEVRNWHGLLKRVATQAALDHLRQRGRISRRHDAAPDWNPLTCSEPGPRDQVEQIELAELLRTALAELPPQQAEVFVLRQINEFSYQEIADALALDVNTVGVLLHRARTRLAEIMGVQSHRSRGSNNAQRD